MPRSNTLARLLGVSLSLGALGALGACAPQTPSGDHENGGQHDDHVGPDAGVASLPPDAPTQQHTDAGVPTPPPDAGCAPAVSQLLVNPAFDTAPMGTGWTQTRIDAAAPIVTDEDGVAERSAPYKAWLGGIAAPTGATVKDVLSQQFVIPVGTTQLTLTGVYDVRTAEAAGTTAYDVATVTLTKADGTAIQTVLSLSNLTPKTDWTPFGHVFTQDLAGQTVRLRLTSINDEIDVTSFFFDNLSLNAITGCPPIP